MAEKPEVTEAEPTIAEDVVVTKYKMAGDMANRKPVKLGVCDVSWRGGKRRDREGKCRNCLRLICEMN